MTRGEVGVAGPAAKTDYSQRAVLQRALDKFPTEAPIHAVARTEAVQDALAAYETADAAALALQAGYRRWARIVLRATAIGGLLGAIVLLPPWVLGSAAPAVRGAVGGLQAIALLVGIIAIQWIGWHRPLDGWMRDRAEAEHQRGEIFRALVTAATPPGADPGQLAGQKLAVSMEAHVGDQLAFYRSACRRHAKGASRVSPLRLLGYALIGIALVLSLVSLADAVAELARYLGWRMPAWLEWLAEHAHRIIDMDGRRWQVVAGTVSSSVLAYAAARSLLDQNERNLSLYTAVVHKLDTLIETGRARAEQAAAEGRIADVAAFLDEARTIMQSEHAIWIGINRVAPTFAKVKLT